jgi:RNA polymerase sigma-70 factor, ECF subfamily
MAADTDSPLEPPDAVYVRHRETVRNALRMLGVEPASLDDAVQDVFAVFHRRLGDYDRQRSVTNWLWGIARGVASGHRRRAGRRARLHAALQRVAPRAQDPMRRVEAHAELDAMLATLDAETRAILVLAEVEGRTGPEIAERLDMNVNTVYARLRTARLRLREQHAAPARRGWTAAVAAWWSEPWLAAQGVAAAGLALALTIVGWEVDASRTPVAIETLGDRPPLVAGRDRPPPLAGLRPLSLRPEIEIEIEIELDEPVSPPRRRRAHGPPPNRLETAERFEPALPDATDAPAAPNVVFVVSRPPPTIRPDLFAMRDDFVGELASLVDTVR